VTGFRLISSREVVPLQRHDTRSLLSVWWLGQAGFLVEAPGVRLIIDAYLSDTLAVKYKGKPFPHVRMMPPPVEPYALKDVDVVLATHGHTDHLDPGTLGPLAMTNPACEFVVPAAHAALAVSRGVPPERLFEASAFSTLDVAGVRVHPLPSAHEELSVDTKGEYLFLGYVLEFPSAVIYHSGDCVPYPELVSHLRRHAIDLALLPVNGRDTRRAQEGVPGNFTLEEASSLARASAVGAVIGHHFGMFDFNTIDVAVARGRLSQEGSATTFLLAEAGLRYDLRPSRRRDAPRSGARS